MNCRFEFFQKIKISATIIAATGMLLSGCESPKIEHTRPAPQNKISSDTHSNIETECDKIVNKAIQDGIIGGAVLCSGNLKQNDILKAYGFADADKKIPMRTDTIIDMASVTKVVATATALAICCDRRLMKLDAPITDYLKFSCNIQNAPSVENVAMHIGGFTDKPLAITSRESAEKRGETILKTILNMPPQNQNGNKYKYCCTNYIILSQAIENVTKENFKDFTRENIFEKLRMDDTSLGTPTTNNPERLAKTLGTSKAGEISDPPARAIYKINKCAGNAGLFSTAGDLAKFCRMMLRMGKTDNETEIISKYMFTKLALNGLPKDMDAKRSLGWEMRVIEGSEFSSNTISHSGWSGQFIIIDFNNDFFAVILTTRLSRQTSALSLRHELAKRLCKYNKEKTSP